MTRTRETVAALPDIRPNCAPGAIILGGAHGSLAIARSLGRRGIRVWFVTDDHPITRFSRYCERSVRWHGPQHAGACDHLLDLARANGLVGWVLFAGGEAEVRLIAENHAALSAVFRLTTPPWAIAQFAYDKRLTHERAVSLGIDYPWSYYPRSRQDAAEVECRFPLILKPRSRQGDNAFTSAKAWQVGNREELLTRYDEAVSLAGRESVSLQELIPGNGKHQYSYAGVWHRGVPVVSLTARRRRQYPIDFGFTSTCVEVVVQEQVEEAACRFLSSLNYDGLVEVEFKYDQRDGRYKLLDVNARPWTWNALGAVAGVDFPYVAWQVAIGQQVSPFRARQPATWMHVSRDVVAAIQHIRRGDDSLAGYLRTLRTPLVFAAFAWDDPLPGIFDLPLTVYRTLQKRLRKAGTETLAPSLSATGDRPARDRHRGASTDGASGIAFMPMRLDGRSRNWLNSLRHRSSDRHTPADTSAVP